MDDEICWLVSQYCFYVYEQKKIRAHNYTVAVYKSIKHVNIELYVKNQRSQNVLALMPFYSVGGVGYTRNFGDNGFWENIFLTVLY